MNILSSQVLPGKHRGRSCLGYPAMKLFPALTRIFVQSFSADSDSERERLSVLEPQAIAIIPLLP